MRIVNNKPMDVRVFKVKFLEVRNLLKNDDFQKAYYKCDKFSDKVKSMEFKAGNRYAKPELIRLIGYVKVSLGAVYSDKNLNSLNISQRKNNNVFKGIVTNISKIESIINKNESRTKVSLWSRIFG